MWRTTIYIVGHDGGDDDDGETSSSGNCHRHHELLDAAAAAAVRATSVTTCTGELRRKMACEKCIRQDPFSKGAIPTHPSVANPSPTQPERGRILHPSAGRVVRDDKLM